MCSAIKNWPKLLSEAYTAIKPGGWIEIQDLQYKMHCDDNTMSSTYDVQKFLGLVHEGLAAFGIDLSAMVNNIQVLRDAGFINVETRVFKVPCGVWPKNKTMKMIGLYLRSVIFDGLQAISMGPFTRGLKWTPEEVEVFLVDVRKSLFDASTHSYLPFHVFYGQKPLDA
ncbi:putative mRNA 3'-end-processing protein YTH1 [Glarea lozoyensis 74030]|nr:putative mRNA 3'-end-processing protein YTH1 [Glarea lozoyensis 74030]